MSDQVIGRFIGAAKDKQRDLAEIAMKFPKADPFGHGVQVGQWQGIEFALDILDNLLRDHHQKELES